jgi:magnesium chelatase family protein
VEYPANFILIATANPCPCGYYSGGGSCACLAYQVKHYNRRLSGPILDRIDLSTPVHDVKYTKLLRQAADQKRDQAQINQVAAARQLQTARQSKLNSDMTNSDLRHHAHLKTEAEGILNTAARQLKLSARAYMRTVKVARTIADLERSDPIATSHISEALTYRPQSFDP